MIELTNIEKSFSDTPLFTLKEYTIQDGNITALYGPSGCGKTTLLNMISLLDFRYKGEIKLDGETIRKGRKAEKIRQNLFSYVFSQDYLIDYLTPRENIILSCQINKKKVPERIYRNIEEEGMTPLLDKNISQLSQGEKQRFSIFRALALEKKYLIMDEPTAHLDKENSIRICEILQKQKQSGKTIIIACHDQNMKPYFNSVLEFKNHEII